jgi:predicted DNA-binding protein (MmcQ/YjbR family)
MTASMASAKDALVKVRKICLSLPDTTEGNHHGKAAFLVGGKLFATCGGRRGCQITFGLEPDHAQALVESDPRFTSYPRDKRAVVLEAADVKSWSEVEALLVESYHLAKPTRDAKPRRSIPPKRARR